MAAITSPKSTSIEEYNQKQAPEYRVSCELLQSLFSNGLPQATSKVWHSHPVWFIDENPIVGYSIEKRGLRIMFWSGRSFNEPLLTGTSTFKDASIFLGATDEIDQALITTWLEKARVIQWDYKNIVKRQGELVKLGDWEE